MTSLKKILPKKPQPEKKVPVQFKIEPQYADMFDDICDANGLNRTNTFRAMIIKHHKELK